jgi:tetratricopeptide (TPR) repeat protein
LFIRKEIRDHDGESRTLNGLGSVYRALEKKAEALRCYKEALHISNDVVGNRYWEGIILQNIGKIYFKQQRNDVALACFLLAYIIFEELQSPVRDTTQERINDLRSKVEEKQFTALLATVEPQASQIVGQALREGLE